MRGWIVELDRRPKTGGNVPPVTVSLVHVDQAFINGKLRQIVWMDSV
jgi:hypothetical protein